jgi:DNA (cytosine-5)-methyltransferase 1
LKYNAIDLFAGCGGVSEGLHQAGFNVVAAIELNRNASKAYSVNHKKCIMFNEDIRNFNTEKIKEMLKGKPLHLLSGCPPCQGFSSMRRLNRKKEVND